MVSHNVRLIIIIIIILDFLSGWNLLSLYNQQELAFLYQRLSVALQKGNASCISSDQVIVRPLSTNNATVPGYFFLFYYFTMILFFFYMLLAGPEA